MIARFLFQPLITVSQFQMASHASHYASYYEKKNPSENDKWSWHCPSCDKNTRKTSHENLNKLSCGQRLQPSNKLMYLNISLCMKNHKCLLRKEKASIIKWVVTSIIKQKKAGNKSLRIKVNRKMYYNRRSLV